MRLKTIWLLLKDTAVEWQEDKASLWAAAIAFYTIFSIAPLLIIAIAIAGAVFGRDAAESQTVAQIQELIGQQGAQAVQAIIQNAQQPGAGGTLATLFGIATLLLGASGVFAQLQEALNVIWDVNPQPGLNIRGFLQKRLLSFAIVLVIGFLLLVSLLASAALAAIANFFGHLFPTWIQLGRILNFIFSLIGTTLLFALIYKVLPDIKIAWSNLWIGATTTALLFALGKYFIGLYLGNSSIGSSYGAASSLVIVLIWVFFSAQILLLGAEFTQVYAKRNRYK
ncbi:YihY/virulence factor BrkB family protein [Chroococcidiopsis sp. FACHB-1243]|uniref:YihY/virulence factor BrkB family protein n=1 Tax=Chroococcidiopsis sp. [FACHB-1243] TaxID=2692781 RepID=UPI0017804E21|nr:YihY/virulence factor BrkB family protein [Chroococcidiopsis sp. [FACHB-1243]]MBD2307741.1 YihY/virulence factor BrkB family protein [Chroococcidiopsis sp. [FACHB-1243]]